MIGRLHYATIAISILLVAILLAASLIFSSDELQPKIKTFHKFDLQQEINLPSFIKNSFNQNDEGTNYVYRVPTVDSNVVNPTIIIKPAHIAQASLYIKQNQKLALLDNKTRYDFARAPEFMGSTKAFNISQYRNAELYVHITHYRKIEPRIEIWEYADYNRIDNQYNQLFTAIFFGILLLILINAFFYLIIRRKEYLLYIFYNSSFLFFLMGSTGYIYQFPALSVFADDKNSLYILLCLSIFALFSFTQAFLSTHRLAPLEHKILNVYRVAMMVFFTLGFLIKPIPQAMISTTNFVIVSAFPLYIWLVVKLLKRASRQAFFFALAFALLIFAGVCRILATFGILPMNFVFNHGFAIASLLEATIFTLGLADRVLQMKQQRDSAKKESMERSQAYELQKDFSTLLNKITQKLHASESHEYEDIVVKTFLKELREKLHFLSAAAIYQMDTRLHVYTKTEHDKNKYNQVIKNNSLQIKRICDLNVSRRLEAAAPYDHMFVIPVTMRRHEWSCLILEVSEDFKLTSSMLDFLQHYATELIRCLLNIESLRLIKNQAETDDLTKLLNRGAILERLELQLTQAKRHQTHLSIAFVDVDDFKQVNDSFGHEAGDRCLTNLAKLLQQKLPNTALIGRYGGDEFLVILPGVSQHTAKNYLDKIQQRIIPLIVEDKSCRYTLSIGISQTSASTKDSLELIRDADKALYVSKNQGKNQINLAKS